MTNVKLIGLLVAILIISSCISIASSTLPFTSNGNVSYTPLASNSPFPFPTSTPIPTPTPEPTATSIPTPRPEPSTWPTLTIQCTTTPPESNLKAQVSGTLSYNKTGIPNAAIYVGFSVDCGRNWTDFSLVQTCSDGTFDTLWTPNATGNYMLKAYWDGNNTLHWLNSTVNLALIPDSAGNVFSVVSNSTVTNFAYNSATQELSFNTNGTSSTTGYANICIPKALVGDIKTLQVSKDGQPIAFATESTDDVWVISCVYAQSEHAFLTQIPFMQMLSPTTYPWIAIVITIAALIAVVAILVVVRRRRKTAATVASILKQNRPMH
jgi:hypothetical protein